MIKSILTLVFALLILSCSKDQPITTTPPEPVEPTPPPTYEAFSDVSVIGVYDNAEGVYLFDKAAHQLTVNPQTFTFRIGDNNGDKYIQVVLSDMPTLEQAVMATLSSNVGLEKRTFDDIILLRQEDNRLWLWSESTLTGLLLPWYDL